MISIIVGTNKQNSKSLQVAEFLSREISEARILDLSTLPSDFIHANMYSEQHPLVAELQDRFLIEPEKIIWVMPEYNGTFPGYLKLFIDACSVRNYRETFGGKKMCLIGLGSGRGGNLRGLDHFTTAMNYMGSLIYPQRMAISRIDSVIVNDEWVSEPVKKDLVDLMRRFQEF